MSDFLKVYQRNEAGLAQSQTFFKIVRVEGEQMKSAWRPHNRSYSLKKFGKWLESIFRTEDEVGTDLTYTFGQDTGSVWPFAYVSQGDALDEIDEYDGSNTLTLIKFFVPEGTRYYTGYHNGRTMVIPERGIPLPL